MGLISILYNKNLSNGSSWLSSLLHEIFTLNWILHIPWLNSSCESCLFPDFSLFSRISFCLIRVNLNHLFCLHLRLISFIFGTYFIDFHISIFNSRQFAIHWIYFTLYFKSYLIFKILNLFYFTQEFFVYIKKNFRNLLKQE